jgi:hypothetical protein
MTVIVLLQKRTMLHDGDDQRIIDEGVAYRTNGRGEIRKLGLWQTRAEVDCPSPDSRTGGGAAERSRFVGREASSRCISRRQPTNNEEMLTAQTAPKRQEGEGNRPFNRIA